MAESVRNPDVEKRINEHLEAIDKELAAKGVPLTERRSVTGDVEAQIRDMLSGTTGNAPTTAEVESILRKLDAPESYAEDAEAESFEQHPLAAQAAPPSFSRAAIIGAVWAPLVFFLYPLFLPHSVPHVSGTPLPPPSSMEILARFTVLPLGLCAPFGATILGWIAVSQIRKSNGQLYGLGFALATGLFYPLLALDAAIAVSIWLPVAGIATWLSPDINAHSLKYLFIAFDLVSAAAVCAFVDYRIVRWAWRKVNAAKHDAMTSAAG